METASSRKEIGLFDALIESGYKENQKKVNNLKVVVALIMIVGIDLFNLIPGLNRIALYVGGITFVVILSLVTKKSESSYIDNAKLIFDNNKIILDGGRPNKSDEFEVDGHVFKFVLIYAKENFSETHLKFYDPETGKCEKTMQLGLVMDRDRKRVADFLIESGINPGTEIIDRNI